MEEGGRERGQGRPGGEGREDRVDLGEEHLMMEEEGGRDRVDPQ